jgi:hypothetical protein
MSVFRKAALCLLITALFAGAFSALSWFSLFDLVEVEFYAPAISRDAADKLNAETRLLGDAFENLQERFSGALQNEAVKLSVSLNQNERDIFERSRIFGELLTTTPLLQWVRLIDGSGSRSRIHFSTEGADYFIRSDNTAAYRAWTEASRHIPITDEMLSDSGGIIFDELYERLLFYMPFRDTRNIKRGVALFAVSSGIIDETLFTGSFIKTGEPVSIVSNPGGILIGLREEADAALRETVAGIWNSGIVTRNVVRSSTNHTFVLFSKQTGQGVFTGFLVDEQLFAIPLLLKMIMLICFCVTVFIISFFIVNIKQDAVVIVQNRMKNLQVSLFREYCEHKIDMNWLEWKRELARRREDVRAELRHGFSVYKSKEVDDYINLFFDKCWDELIAVISNQNQDMMGRLDEEKIEDILKRILEASSILAGIQAGHNEATVLPDSPLIDEADEIEELSGLEELSEIEEAEEAGVLSKIAESDMLDELGEFEEVDEIKELNSDQTTRSLKTEDPAISTVSAAIINEIKAKAELEKAEQDRIKQEKIREQEQEEKRREGEAAKVKEYQAVEAEIMSSARLLENDPFEGSDGVLSDDAEGLSYGDFVRLDIPVSGENLAGFSGPEPEFFAPADDDSDPFAGISGAEFFPDDMPEIIGDDALAELPEILESLLPEDGIPEDEIEEFVEASEEDLTTIKKAPPVPNGPAFTFEDPHKGSDINKIAMQIEFSKSDTKDWEHDFDMDMDMDMDMIIASPENELFDNIDSNGNKDLIAEKNGVPFIKKKEGEEEELDTGMKNLVNSVLKR